MRVLIAALAALVVGCGGDPVAAPDDAADESTAVDDGVDAPDELPVSDGHTALPQCWHDGPSSYPASSVYCVAALPEAWYCMPDAGAPDGCMFSGKGRIFCCP